VALYAFGSEKRALHTLANFKEPLMEYGVWVWVQKDLPFIKRLIRKSYVGKKQFKNLFSLQISFFTYTKYGHLDLI
jgi:hypothetical protein